jgi:hypothetical protein
MGEEKEILLRRNFCAYLTRRLMGDPTSNGSHGRRTRRKSDCGVKTIAVSAALECRHRPGVRPTT